MIYLGAAIALASAIQCQMAFEQTGSVGALGPAGFLIAQLLLWAGVLRRKA